MRRLIPTLAIALACALSLPVAAQADFGLSNFDLTATNEDATPATQAGSHPFAVTNTLELNRSEEAGKFFTDGRFKDLIVEQMGGLIGDPTSYPRCSTVDFLSREIFTNLCPNETAIGVNAAAITDPFSWTGSPVYNLTPPPGVLLRIGFPVSVENIIVDFTLMRRAPYSVLASVRNTPQAVYVYGNKLQLWGNPSDPVHDALRGKCYGQNETGLSSAEEFEFESDGSSSCPVAARPRPLLTLPTRCSGANRTSYATDSFENPGAFLEGEPDLSDPDWVTGALENHDAEGDPQPFTACDKLSFKPSITAQPTTRAASSPTGLDFSLDVKDEGLTSLGGLAHSQIRSVRVTLPEQMSINPSIADGLEVCTGSDLARETLSAPPGTGCPDASKIGSVEVESPLLEEPVKGALFQAQQDDPATPQPGAENPFDSLIVFYLVIKNPALGIIVKQPVAVHSDPATGQLTTTAEDLPQLPFSHFRLHFREGTRSPLASPPLCGTYSAEAELTPYSGGAPLTTTATFEIISGPDNTPCPSGGTPPFHPRLEAGTLNNAAGHFSTFYDRISRTDSEQEITNTSIKLPPGIVGKLAGIPFCPEAAIATALSREHPLGGQEELASPSCPAASYLGRTLAGSGVGPSLAYAPGSVYLAGPYHGAPISLVAITAAVVGPFDLGTVLVRFAVRVNPETGEVFIDATGSDPIPHIIEGIPVHLREIRAYVDRPDFVLNPTSCEPTSTASTVLGSGLDFVSPADDNPFVATSRFQAADCAALPFNPKLTFKLKGSTKRGGNPSLRAHVAMNGIGEAAIRYAQVSLPRSEFLDNAHIGTVCTRVQFREGAVPGERCPAASVYGHVSALTPILEGPLSGPIYLRSSEHELPDLVAALHHEEINVVLVGRVDSVKGGGIRNTFEFVPDAPVTSADFVFDGAAKGLLQNSTNLCKGTHKVKVLLKAHSGKRVSYKTPLRPTGCRSGKKAKPNRHGLAGARR